jgi:hypothetical protein
MARMTISAEPADYLTPDDHTEAQHLRLILRLRIRNNLSSRLRDRGNTGPHADHATAVRRQINAARTAALDPAATITDHHREWTLVADLARRETTTPGPEADRLHHLATLMLAARDREAAHLCARHTRINQTGQP